MIIQNEIETTLKKSGYNVLYPKIEGVEIPLLAVEDDSYIGFIFVFQCGAALLSDWEKMQNLVLKHFSKQLLKAGEKAWNIYTVLLAEHSETEEKERIEKIEEDFSLSRKIAKHSVQTVNDVSEALLPFIAVKSRPEIDPVDFAKLLEKHLQDLPNDALVAFLRGADGKDIAQLLGAKS